MSESASTTVARQRVYLTPADIADFFWPLSLSGQDRSDFSFHRVRWSHLLTLADELITRRETEVGRSSLRALDVGISLQTDLLRANLPDVPVDTLDLHAARREPRQGEHHYEFDLNRMGDDEVPDAGPYDLIVLAEVVEHIFVGARRVFEGFGHVLKPGGFLIVQTPNAAALHKRLKLFSGRQPYMTLDSDATEPPHFHEHTLSELSVETRNAGLEVERISAHNYFTQHTIVSNLYNAVAKRLPDTLRSGITLVARRPN